MPDLSGRRVLVTGGAGFVGSNLVRLLLARDTGAVHVIDNLLSAERSNLPSDRRVTLVEGSAADDRVLDLLSDEFDLIFHLCTYHGNQSSIHDPLADHAHNLLPTLKLFERVKGFRRLASLVYSGAGCAVARKTAGDPVATAEDSPISFEMDSPYSISKLVGELYGVYYAKQCRVPIVRARFQNVYGPGEILGAGRWRGTPATVWRNVTPTFVFKSLKQESLPLEGGGHASRDFIFVDDVAEGLVACALNGAPGDVYNLASGVETTIRELAALIDGVTGNSTPPHTVPGRPWDRSGRRYGSPEKAERELGFRARMSLDSGLERTVAWTRANLPIVEQCIERHQPAILEYERSHQNALA